MLSADFCLCKACGVLYELKEVNSKTYPEGLCRECKLESQWRKDPQDLRVKGVSWHKVQ